ncbi:glycosyltransferase, partial [Candidatus Omnitrophota bacterium]
PCDPVFSISKDPRKLIEQLGLKDGLFNLLIMGGGFGTGPVREVVDFVCGPGSTVQNKVQAIVICGKNKKLFDELAAKKDLKGRLSIFGYMDNIDEFMEVSDLIITKSGGLTVSEALSKKLPMIVIQPIPGQETRNCNILEGYGAAVRANTARDAVKHVEGFIRNPSRIIGMKARINLLSFPDAAKDIGGFLRGL